MAKTPNDFVPAKSKLIFISIESFYDKKLKKQAKAKYKCQCGKIFIATINNVKSGNTVSCGCIRKGVRRQNLVTHGMTRTPIYNLWRAMKNRCTYPSSGNYKYYGAKGVKVCEEWENDFMSFYNWCMDNGYKKGLYLDKDIKAKKLGVTPNLYSPDRCTFVTKHENDNCKKNNRFIEFNGVSKTICDWAISLGIHHRLIRTRIMKYGWTVERALTTHYNTKQKP
jgi:hypothetical protein